MTNRSYRVFQVSVDVHDDSEVGQVVTLTLGELFGRLDQPTARLGPTLQRVVPETAERV